MNRGFEGRSFFAAEPDKVFFLALLKKVQALTKIRVPAYCVMDNHYHLVLQNVSGKMSRIQEPYPNLLMLQKIGEMLGMKYRSVAELERYFIDELTKKMEMKKIVAGVKQDLRKKLCWGECRHRFLEPGDPTPGLPLNANPC